MNAESNAAPGREPGREQDLLLAQLESLVRAQVPRSRQALLTSFVRQYYEPASLDALKLRTPQQLVSLALAHWEVMEQRKPGEAVVQVLPPDAAGATPLALVRTCIDDMPFLVDSVSMAVRDAGSVIDWAVHPVLRLRRSPAGAVGAVFNAQAGEGAPESLIHAEIDPLAAPENYAALEQGIRAVLADLRTVVDEFGPMRAKAREVADALSTVPPGGDALEFAEAREFLLWLENERFTFLGYSETELKSNKEGKPTFANKPAAALGLSRRGGRFADAEQLIAPKSELDKYAESPRLVVITKASQKSPVRHAEYMDVISIKRFSADGTLRGTSRFLGLFSVEAYIERPRSIPLIRRKADYVMARSHVQENSYSGKTLRLIMHTLPRDEMFQSGEDELFQTCMGIRALRDRHQLKLFMRRDRYGRFFSCMVYVPRERYSRELRDRVGAELMQVCNGNALERNVEFPRGQQARIHYIVRTAPGATLTQTTAQIEQRLIAVTRTWRDQLRDLLLLIPGKDSAQLAARYADAFPLSYTEDTPPLEAAEDLRYLSRLNENQRLLINAGGKPNALKLYSWGKPVGLSDVLPLLENFGLRTVRQEPTEVTPKDGETLWLQTFEISAALTAPPTEAQKAAFETAFSKCWAGEIENDGLNRLVLGAGLDWRQVTCVRLVTKYLIQTGLPYSQAYMEQLLGDHSQIAGLLVQLFEARFNPALAAKRQDEEIKIAQALDAALDKVASLDGDRVLRAFLSVVRAGLRTNYYQVNAAGEKKTYVSLKIDSSKVPELPLPRPLYEVFVYAPEVEGVHLRGGKVARGGLRWSDRRQDFRTEVLGLMKAQQVKNTVIVPVGAKGGFVVKKPVDAANREAWMAQGIACYQTFVRGLLDITDNRVAGKIVPPVNVVRHDADDPYLVVAADKGTATFSDIANALSAEYSFWLGDAFASGGSVGYDHKKMGITAKGAWESVKRHFREAGKNIQEEEFSVVGVGDMSGDVFGNGMLLSRKIRLLAAFDHRHIFLDPNPDCEASFVERERMFALPRSSWADYNAALISKGGGVHARSLKSIRISDEVKKTLDIKESALTPAELMKAILKAPVDLLWNGGIGTYVKSSAQSQQEVGDRANDNIRVNGKELRCKVIGEGGNLGCTQLGRVEYALAGGRLNTDAIDNAGGVHSSDREVNIKIPLNELMAQGKLTRKERDPLLAKLTDDVARFVLRDNYVQSAAVSMLQQNAPARLEEHAELIRLLERDGLLNRQIEFLPDDESMKERRSHGRGLTRPELSVLLAYSKISLKEAMLKSHVPDDEYFERDLLANFPPLLIKKYGEVYAKHQLRREIVATLLTNAVVNRMGISFSHRLAEDHGVPRAQIIQAYAAAHQIYSADRYWLAIEALDNKVKATLQYSLYDRAIGLLKHATGWIVSSDMAQRPIGEIVARFSAAIPAGEKLLPDSLPPSYRADWDKAVAAMTREHVPQELAVMLANTKVLGSALDIVELAEEAKAPLTETAQVYFEVGERFHVLWLLSSIVGLAAQSKWQALARANLRDDVYRLQRLLTARVLRAPGKTATAKADAWIATNEAAVGFARRRLAELQTGGVADFMSLAVAVRALRDLRTL